MSSVHCRCVAARRARPGPLNSVQAGYEMAAMMLNLHQTAADGEDAVMNVISSVLSLLVLAHILFPFVLSHIKFLACIISPGCWHRPCLVYGACQEDSFTHNPVNVL